MSDGGVAAIFAVLGIGGLRVIHTALALVARVLALVFESVFGVARSLSSLSSGDREPASGSTSAHRPNAPLSDDDVRDIPIRILNSTTSRERAMEKFASYREWSARFRLHELLRTPKPYFDVIKAHYPQVMHHTTDKEDFVIIMEKPGHVPELLHAVRETAYALGRDEDDATEVVLEHFAFVSTFLYERVDAREHPYGKIVQIIDLSAVSMSDVLGIEVFGFLREYSASAKIANIERVHRVFIVNPPPGFAFVFNACKPLISTKTLKQIVVCASVDDARREMSKVMSLDKVPKEYGGACACGRCWRGDANEDALHAYVHELNSRCG